MILIPTMMVGGHLLIAVAETIPDLNIVPTCREAASGILGIKERFDLCIGDESIARDQLGKENGTSADAIASRGALPP